MTLDSNEFRDRPVLFRRSVRQVEECLVDVAPAPVFGWIVAFDDRVAGGVEVLGGVPVRRIVAAADMAALTAYAQMHPPVAGLETLLAAECARRHVADRIEMTTAIDASGFPGGSCSSFCRPDRSRIR